jgi:hypothetical protein
MRTHGDSSRLRAYAAARSERDDRRLLDRLMPAQQRVGHRILLIVVGAV